jgi:hypothetical protein
MEFCEQGQEVLLENTQPWTTYLATNFRYAYYTHGNFGRLILVTLTNLHVCTYP